jgi:hypothetical protein
MTGYRREGGRRRFVWLAASILCMFIGSSLLTDIQARQGSASAQPPPGFNVRIQAQPLKATVGDPIQIDLDFTLPRGYQLVLPHLPAQVGEFTILEGPAVPSQQTSGKASSPPLPATRTQGSGERHQLARIVVAVYKTGNFDFPTLPFVLRDAEGKQIEVVGPTVKIRIESVLSDKDLSLKDLKKQADIEETRRWLLWLGLSLAAVVLFSSVWWWLKRRRSPSLLPFVRHDVDPLDLAEADLRDLIGRGLLQKGMVKQFYICLSEIVKKVLEAGYGIQTVEKTTSEIIAALSVAPGTGTANPEPAALEPIETLLLSCDLVKFARYAPSGAENEEVVNQAAQILVDCRARRQPAIAGAALVAGGS